MSPEMALRDISQVRNDKVAFGVKRTSMGGQGWVAQSRLDPEQTRGGLKTRSAARPAVARRAILTIGCRIWHRHCALARCHMVTLTSLSESVTFVI
jgi:hypothetical protein